MYDRVHITGIALRSLRIVALENAADVLMPFADQRLCSCIAAGIIVSYDVDYIFANNIWVIAVDENDRNAAQGQRMIKLPVRVRQRGFCSFYNDSVGRVAQQIGENGSLRGNAVVCGVH